MSVSQTNYRENYFQHPTLTKITGDPTYASLAKLEKECKANGKSVRTTLGGGLQGHLGLVTSASERPICHWRIDSRVNFGIPFPNSGIAWLQITSLCHPPFKFHVQEISSYSRFKILNELTHNHFPQADWPPMCRRGTPALNI